MLEKSKQYLIERKEKIVDNLEFRIRELKEIQNELEQVDECLEEMK